MSSVLSQRFTVPLGLSIVLLMCAAGPALAGEIDEAGLDAHREFLDSAELGSRRVGEDGLLPASRYLAVQLRRLGFEGVAPDGSYFLPVSIELLRPGAPCLVSLIDRETPLRSPPARASHRSASPGRAMSKGHW